jgi:GR25 family glycosyltransferase involved in LPS biosynthesis
MRVNDFFENVFYINLKRRPDRLEQINQELEKHGIGAELVEAIDGNDLEQPTVASADGLMPSRGDIACALSHAKVCRMAKERGLRNYLVVEDDAVFAKEFDFLFSGIIEILPSDYDIVYLGGSHNEKAIPITHNIVRGTKIFTTHAIGVRETMYDALIDVWEKRNEKVDIAVASLQKQFNCYAFNPFIVGQRPSHSDILNRFTDYKHLRV